MVKAKPILALLLAAVLVSPLYAQGMMDCGMHNGAGHGGAHQEIGGVSVKFFLADSYPKVRPRL